jgi:enoyl-CoA hydratase/carnithine racemase
MPNVKSERAANVAPLMIDRAPERNALGRATLRELEAAARRSPKWTGR